MIQGGDDSYLKHSSGVGNGEVQRLKGHTIKTWMVW